ncbi:MAG TPA: PqqD family protein [Solirubrobacteraceae bacterium]|nr:PqqD family protein [Solirubrobacteraceae bacterium]
MTRLEINAETVVYETIEDETIVINMRTGTYYSLKDSGSELWSQIELGIDRPRLLAYALERWDGESDEIEAGVAELVDELLTDGLVVEIEGQNEGTAAGVPATTARTPFAAPVLERFTDMQEFMLVDPLHDVDADAGWPHVQPA